MKELPSEPCSSHCSLPRGVVSGFHSPVLWCLKDEHCSGSRSRGSSRHTGWGGNGEGCLVEPGFLRTQSAACLLYCRRKNNLDKDQSRADQSQTPCVLEACKQPSPTCSEWQAGRGAGDLVMCPLCVRMEGCREQTCPGTAARSALEPGPLSRDPSWPAAEPGPRRTRGAAREARWGIRALSLGKPSLSLIWGGRWELERGCLSFCF